MPTGYTSDLYDGEQSFADFTMRCARAFGALISMRDDAFDAEIPDEFVPSTYLAESMARARAEYDRLVAMSSEEATAEATRLADEWEAERARYLEDRTQREDRYVRMLGKVAAWDPPTPEHQGLKDFMIEQLNRSIDADCSNYERPDPERDGEKWRQHEIERAIWNMEYYATEHAAEVERARRRTAWVRALRDSLSTGGDDGLG